MNSPAANTNSDDPLAVLARDGVSEMLNDPEITRLIVGYLVENDVPKPAALLIYRTFRAVAGKVEGHLTEKLAGKIGEWINNFPPVKTVLSKLSSDYRAQADLQKTKETLLLQLQDDDIVASDSFKLDATASLEAMLALSANSRLKGLDEALQVLGADITRQFEMLRQDMSAPTLAMYQIE